MLDSDAPNFIPWGEYKLDVLNGYTRFKNQSALQRQPVALKELTINAPSLSKAENPVNQDLYGTVKRMKLRLEIEAESWQLDEFMVAATILQEEANKGNTLEQPCPVEAFHELTGDWEYTEFGQ